MSFSSFRFSPNAANQRQRLAVGDSEQLGFSDLTVSDMLSKFFHMSEKVGN